MLLYKYAPQEAESKAPLGVSAERFRGDAGRSLVVADYPRHDASAIPNLQGIPGVLRRNRDEHIGRSSAEAASSWNHHHGNGAVGSPAREYRQSSTCPANAKGQGAILG